MAGRRAGSSKFCLPIRPKQIPPLLAQTPSFEPKSRVLGEIRASGSGFQSAAATSAPIPHAALGRTVEQILFQYDTFFFVGGGGGHYSKSRPDWVGNQKNSV